MKTKIFFKPILLGLFLLLCSEMYGQHDSYTYNKLKTQYEKVNWSSVDNDPTLKGYYIVEKNGKQGLCDYEGKVIVTPQFTKIDWMDAKSKTFRVRKDDFYGLIDITGKTIIPANKYTKLAAMANTNSYPAPSYEKYVRIYLDDKVGVADINGNVIIAPTRFTNIKYQEKNNGFGLTDDVKRIGDKDAFWIYIGNNTGLCTTKGKVLLEPVEEFYDMQIVGVREKDSVSNTDCYKTYSQYIMVKKHGDSGYGVVNKNGTYIIPRNTYYPKYYPEYDIFISDDYSSKNFKAYSGSGKLLFEGESCRIAQGVMFVKKNGLYGMMNPRNGEILVDFKYTSMDTYFNDEGVTKASIGGESMLIRNPLRGGGVVSTMQVKSGKKSDLDILIPQTQREEENTFAVIVANETYENTSCVHAINDGKVFRDYCIRALGIPESNIIYQEDATLNNMVSMLQRVTDIAEVYEGEARVLFFFSGIGTTDDQRNAYLMPSDGSATMPQTTAYSLKKLFDQLGNMNVQQVLSFIDAGFNNQPRDENKKDSQGIKVEPVKGNCVVFMAGDTKEGNYSYKSQGHGLFTYFLLKKIQDADGKAVSFFELTEFVRKNVSERALKDFSARQTPQVYSSEKINLKKIML